MLRFERLSGLTTESGSYDGWKRYFRKIPKMFNAVVRGFMTMRYGMGMGASGRMSRKQPARFWDRPGCTVELMGARRSIIREYLQDNKRFGNLVEMCNNVDITYGKQPVGSHRSLDPESRQA